MGVKNGFREKSTHTPSQDQFISQFIFSARKVSLTVVSMPPPLPPTLKLESVTFKPLLPDVIRPDCVSLRGREPPAGGRR